MSAKTLQKHYSIYEESERRAYSRWINKVLCDDKDCLPYLPLDPYTNDIYTKIKNGVILCKLLNSSNIKYIDERAINIDDDISDNHSKSMGNLTLAVQAAACKGANMRNVDLLEICAGDKFAILDLIWQIIRIVFFNLINIYQHPEIVDLKEKNESIDDLKELGPLVIVLRYVNFHLSEDGNEHFVKDFEDDFSDCLVYAHLLFSVAPVSLKKKLTDPATISSDNCMDNRARCVIDNLRLLNADSFLTEEDFVNGFKRRNSSCKLHMSTMMYLFDNFHGKSTRRTKGYGSKGECLEELACRNFLNSFDVHPFSNHLLSSCRNGWILAEMFEILKPGCTSSTKFHLDFDNDRYFYQRLENNWKVAKLCQLLTLNCPNFEATKIAESEKTCIMNVVIEMMQYYLSRDGFHHAEIIEWVNSQLKEAKRKISIKSFTDRSVVEENIFAVLMDLKIPGLINKKHIGKNKVKNHKYLISMAHKAGIPVFTLPEHFVEDNETFIAIAFASLLYK